MASWASPTNGEILVDQAGRVLYLFTPDDASGTPTCTGSCAATWPPLHASGTPRAQGSVDQSKLSVVDGQVAYNRHPLYYYAGDSAPHQTNGQGYGGIWYVVGVDGNANMQ